MAVARDNLRADWLGCQTQFCTDMLFYCGVDIGKRANSARNCPGGNFSACCDQPRAVAIHLSIKARKGQPHSCGFGMDAMASANPYGIFMFECPLFQRRQQFVHIGQKHVCGADQLYVEACVQHIGTGHALMNKARLVAADMFSQMGQKGDHIMFGNRFNLVDARHIECDVFGFPNRLGIGARDHAQIGLCITCVSFDLVPDAELCLGRPDGNHVGAGIAGNHTKSLLSCRRMRRS